MFTFQKTLEEMHLIAYVYHWDRDTLWEMSSGERRMWAKMILAQKRLENAPLEKMKNKSGGKRSIRGHK